MQLISWRGHHGDIRLPTEVETLAICQALNEVFALDLENCDWFLRCLSPLMLLTGKDTLKAVQHGAMLIIGDLQHEMDATD